MARPFLEFGALTPAGLTAVAVAVSSVLSCDFGSGVEELYCCRACSAALRSARAVACSAAFLAGTALRRARAAST